MKYYSIIDVYKDEYIKEKSRFITTLIPVKTVEDTVKFLEEYSDKSATHNCYAYVLSDNVMKSSDDGEPQGTAGIPMLEVLKKRNIQNVLAIVTRFFGGIKLGASGLVSAYTKAVNDALDKANLVEVEQAVVYKMNCEFSLNDSVQYLIKSLKGNILDTQYLNKVIISFAIKKEKEKEFLQKLSSITKGKNNIEKIKECDFYFNINE